MTFVEGVPPSKHFRSPITQPNIPEEQVAYRQFPRPSPLPRRRGYARLVYVPGIFYAHKLYICDFGMRVVM